MDKSMLQKKDEYRWIIPKEYKQGMRVPGLIYAKEEMLEHILAENAGEQVANVATLPGIVRYSLAMPDIHWGYGFPIGGVAAMDPDEGGIISPGGIGYDINCGVRLLRSNLTVDDVSKVMEKLVPALFNNIPCGVGRKGELRINTQELKKLVVEGARWAVKNGYGVEEDLKRTEEYGCIEGADPSAISSRAIERGLPQVGTLGSGNHFLEVQEVVDIYDEEIAKRFGLFKGQVTVMIHSGSRGFGYQVCDDSLKYMQHGPQKYGYTIPDRQLASAPINSPEGERYYAEMCCAANYAWANRQCIMYLTRKVFERIFGKTWEELGMDLVYDVAHNIGKFESYKVNGKEKKLFVHRKGATRAFPKWHPALSEVYRDVGQPVIVPGDMGRNSYVLVGTERAIEESFGSVCHGAGRMMSRHKAINQLNYGEVSAELKSRGIVFMTKERKGLLEEAPEAYKDVNIVVDVVHNAGIAMKVARMKPLGVIKG